MMTHFSKFLKALVCIASLLIANNLSAQTWPPAGMNGNGSQSKPYEITTPEQLVNLATYVNAGNGSQTAGKYYKLMNDIDFIHYSFKSVFGWVPIGNNFLNDAIFHGNFEGNDKVVAHLPSFREYENYNGLFGYISNATIHNLGMETCDITGHYYVGGLVGQANNSIIENCYVSGNINGACWVGGLIGSSNNSTISNCYAICNVSGARYTGGFTGRNESTIETCYAGGNITAIGYGAGGFVGCNFNNILDCYATGNVTGAFSFGGFAGANGNYYEPNNEGNISYCYASGKVIGTEDTDNIGGFIGINSAMLYNCVAANKIVTCGTSSVNVNRIAGINNGTVSHNYAYKDMTISPVGSGEYGADATWSTLTSFKFYHSGSNWYGNTPWSIDDDDNLLVSWKICDGETLPFLQWEEIECNPINACNEYQNGTLAAPYLICTVQDLIDLANAVNSGGGNATTGKYWKLMNNLDLAGINWNPIGYNSGAYSFQGHFEGNGKVISNLTINRGTTNNIGLFGYINNAEIKNLEINSCQITGNQGVGALVGNITGISTIENCYVTGCSISGYRIVGGLIGQLDHYSNLTINNCYASGKVTGTSDVVGGLVGWIYTNTISNISTCYAFCEVKGELILGGLIGYITNNCSVYQCFANGNVQGAISIGGLAGILNNESNITKCYATGSLTGIGGQNSNFGGLLGITTSSNITNCYATGNITINGTSGSSIGGLVGSNIGFITCCFATGNISATGGISQIGGLVGICNNSSTLRNCVAANATVTGGGANINRVVGSIGSGLLSNNYAYDGMIIVPNGGNAGISTPMATLMSFNFYNKNSNWYNNTPWSIDDAPNSSVVWGICEGRTLPFFQWQGFNCGKLLLQAGDNEENSLSVQDEKSSFSTFPNPTSNHITISSEEDFYFIEIVDLYGRIVYSQVNHGNSVKLDVSNYGSGIYFVRVFYRDGTSVRKFVKM